MADSLIQVPTDGSGKKVDTETLTVGAESVHRQRIQIAGTSAAHIAPVSATLGLSVNVTAAAALPAGSNAIGSVTVSSLPAIPTGSNTIGNVGVTSVVTGTGATNLGKAEDGAHTSGDVGVMALGVRTDSTTARSGTDGDYEPIQINAGRVSAASSITSADGATTAPVDGTNGLAVDVKTAVIATLTPGTAAANLGKAEDAAFSDGHTGVMSLAVRTDTPADRSGTDGDYEPIQMSAGRVWTSTTVTAIVPGTAATSLGKAEDGAHTSGDVGVMALGVRTDTPTARSGTDGDYEPFQITGGRLNTTTTITSMVPGTAATSLGKAEDAAHTSGDTGVAMLGVRLDTAASLAGTDGDYTMPQFTATGALRICVAEDAVANGGQQVAASSVSVVTASDHVVPIGPSTSGGLAIHRSIDLDEGTLEIVKASPGQLYGMWVANLATATRFVKFYNATSGTAGTGTPVLTIPIPGNSADDVGGVFNMGGQGFTFSTGICVGATTGVADNDTGAPGANEIVINIGYK